jgi:putative ABC transport system permease protein
MGRKTPLAWLQVTRQKARLAVAVAGVAFADMLMFMQMEFQDALFDSATVPHQSLQADLVMVNPQLQSLSAVKSFPRQRLYQALGAAGVSSVSSVYIETTMWRNPQTRQERGILVWGVEPSKPVFRLPGVAENLDQMKMLDRVLFDQSGRPEYGPIAQIFQTQGRLETELGDRLVRVGGLFTLGASFAADGNILASDSTFLRLFPDRQADRIDLGVIHLQPGATRQSVQAVQAQLQAELPQDVRILTREEFVELEKHFWSTGSPIGFIFSLGVVLGFIVGIVIVYQILYSDVSDHLPEYATLKAMGYSDRYLLTVLMQEALLLAVLGFIPSFLLSFGLYHLTYATTLLPIGMKIERAVSVLILTLIMCGVSGAISMRKLYSADPAEVF